MTRYAIRPIGRVSSALADRTAAPLQADESAPPAVLEFDPDVREGLRNLRSGDEMLLLTWLHLADRNVLSVHPRGDRERAREGVFSTRSPDRPNPVGLHRVRITDIDGLRICVAGLEAVDGTPIVDVKPVLVDDVGLR